MCGLTGVILKKEERSLKQLNMITDKFSMMLKKANSRGGHATGFAVIDKTGNYIICKKPKDSYDFLKNKEVTANLNLVSKNATCIMGHTRYATLGSPHLNANNHPIRAGKTIGTHNGSIQNHRELFKRYNMNRFAQVDSEVVFRLHDTANDISDFVNNRMPKLRGRVALVWADLEYPEYVYMYKGNNPLEMVYVPELKLYAYGSTKEIVNSGFWGMTEEVKMNTNTLIRVNTETFVTRTKTVETKKPIYKTTAVYNTNIGAYENTETVKNFVPRYSYKEQRNLFKTHKLSDGSTIRTIK